MKQKFRELSIFIDESGDFGEFDPKCPYYIISMVLYDQNDIIADSIKKLDSSLKDTKLDRNYIHVGPLIRKEKEYGSMTASERARILSRLVGFARNTKFLQKSFIVEKRHIEDEYVLTQKFIKQLSGFVKDNLQFFQSYDKLKIYYDHGQQGVMRVIAAVFFVLFDNAEFIKALPKDYKMLQVADLVCTAALTETKMKNKTLSRSERRILGTAHDIKRNLLEPLRKKEF